jgi:hypothetical protein
VGGVMPHSFSSTGLPSLESSSSCGRRLGACIVAEQVVALDLERGVVAPLFGIADLVADQVELLFGGLLGLVAHPGQGADVVAEGFLERGYELVHAGLGGRREVLTLTQSWPTASPSAPSVATVHCFQRGVGSFLAGERLAEEGEVFVEEGLGQLVAAPWIRCQRK